MSRRAGQVMAMLRAAVSRAYHSKPFRLALLAFIVYNANLRGITSADTFPTRYLPISILTEFDLDLDEFGFLLDYRGRDPGDQGVPYFMHRSRGHYISNYPVMPGILAVPVYVVPVYLGLTDGAFSTLDFNQTEIVGTLLSKLAASAAVAFSVALVYLSLLAYTDKRRALWIALLYAFATSSWAVSSQGLWQNSMSQPLLALALYLFIRARDNPGAAAYAGIPLALSVACRPPTLIFASVFFVYVLVQHRDQVIRFLVVPSIVAVFLLAYNFYYFGNAVGGYENLGAGQLFSYPRLESLLGLLISPSRGLLVYSPVLIIAFAGLWKVLRQRSDPLLTYTAVATVLLIMFYSTWRNWPGAFSFSYRHMVDLLPGLSLLMAAAFGWVMGSRWRKALFVGLTAFSVIVQVSGTFFYPCRWFETPVHAYEDRSRFWDWGDPEFLRCLKSGPVYPEGLRMLRSLVERA